MALNFNNQNSIVKGGVIYEAGDDITSVSLILNGTVNYSSDVSGKTVSYNAGDFIGIEDIFSGYYSGDYEASSDCAIIPFSCTDCDELSDSLKTYSSIIKSSHSEKSIITLLSTVLSMYKVFFNDVNTFYVSVYNSYKLYTDICTQNFLVPDDFVMARSADNYTPNNLPISESVKKILSAPSDSDTDEALDDICELLVYFEDLIFYLKSLIRSVIGSNNDCLFALVSNLAGSIASESLSVYKLLDGMRTFTIKIDESLKEHLGIDLNLDLNKINFYCSLAHNPQPDTGGASASKLQSFESDKIVLVDSFEKLMDYACYSPEEADTFSAYIEKYKKLKDKAAGDDATRLLRKNISTEFYRLYERVFFQYAKTGQEELYVDLFLNFGLLDETLIDNESLDFLCNLNYSSEGTPATVYYMKDWLMAIYEGRQIPSKNEFDEEYIDYVRKKKKEVKLTPEAEANLLNNPEIKVKYELNNMFRYNHRILNSAPSSFYPMLTCGENDRSLASTFLDCEKVNCQLKGILRTDYSAFYRESMYEDINAGISKELIVREVFPEIILLPCMGVNGIMWQEISGKRINNPGRFILPAFFAGDLSLTMLKLLGRFRWELCKTAQGLAWNDITIPSLTSEYSDYIQFYRKNHELSAEKKEALKNQIARCRNNTRDVFVLDYCLWIKYESTGAMRLNKIVRRIMATYCPFAKDIREKYANHPAFAEAMNKFNIEKAKKCKEITNRYNALSRKGIELTEELVKTQDYYLNM